MVTESQKYASPAASDGGVDPASYETGSKLTLTPFAHGLVGYWPLNEGTGTVVYDNSGYGNNGTLTTASSTCGSACYPQWTTGINGGALSFNTASTSYVQALDSNFPFGSSSRTMIAWIKTADYNKQIMAYGNNCCVGTYSGIYMTQYLYWNGWYYDYNFTQLPVINNNNWHFIVVVVLNATHVIGYVDSQSQSGTISPLNTISSGGKFNIGTGNPNGANGYLTGILDNVRIYNRALTPSQIRAIYNAKQ
jgi:hypothetical protein